MRNRIRLLRAGPVVGLVAAAFVALIAQPALASTSSAATPAGQATVVRQFVRVTPSANGQAMTYAITRATSVLRPGVSAASETVVPFSAGASCPTDGSISVQVCSTLIYTSENDGGQTYGSTISWGNQAIRLDSNSALVDLQWNAAQEGRCLRGCSGYFNRTFTGDYSPPSSGQNYVTSPPWGQPVTLILRDLVAANFQCMNQNLVWKHGTRSFNLANLNLCIPSSG